MKLQIEDEYRSFLFLVCLYKAYHDAGITSFEKDHADDIVNEFDYYYEVVLDAMNYPAPIINQCDSLYQKYNYDPDDGEVDIYAYSSKDMQDYYRIARKLHRLEGNKTKENPYIKRIERKLESVLSFYSYHFDYAIGNKRKGAQIEVLLYFEIDFRIILCMCLWIMRCMKIFSEELPKLREKYRKARTKKHSRPKRIVMGGDVCA